MTSFRVSVSYLVSILRSAIWAQIDVLASWTRVTSVNLVRLVLFLKKINQPLNYRWYARARVYRTHADQLDFLKYIKNQFPYKPRHLRRVWDLVRRVFDEANPNLRGLFLFRHYLEKLFWKKRSKMNFTKKTKLIWILLAESFPTVVSELSYPLRFFRELFFCVRISYAQSSSLKIKSK